MGILSAQLIFALRGDSSPPPNHTQTCLASPGVHDGRPEPPLWWIHSTPRAGGQRPPDARSRKTQHQKPDCPADAHQQRDPEQLAFCGRGGCHPRKQACVRAQPRPHALKCRSIASKKPCFPVSGRWSWGRGVTDPEGVWEGPWVPYWTWSVHLVAISHHIPRPPGEKREVIWARALLRSTKGRGTERADGGVRGKRGWKYSSPLPVCPGSAQPMTSPPKPVPLQLQVKPPVTTHLSARFCLVANARPP